jgi:hypothetical protein
MLASDRTDADRYRRGAETRLASWEKYAAAPKPHVSSATRARQPRCSLAARTPRKPFDLRPPGSGDLSMLWRAERLRTVGAAASTDDHRCGAAQGNSRPAAPADLRCPRADDRGLADFLRTVSGCIPRSAALCAIGRSLSSASRIPRWINSSGYFFGLAIGPGASLSARTSCWLQGLRRTRDGSPLTVRDAPDSGAPPRDEPDAAYW